MKIDTLAVHAAGTDPATGAVSPPIHLSTTFARGEDYELLFTVPRRKREHFERLAEKTGFCFTCIGSITPKRLGLRLRTAAGTAQPLPLTSYEHFLRPS